MRNSAVADRPGSRKARASRQSAGSRPRSRATLIASLLVLLVAAGVGVLLIWRPGQPANSGPANGSDHILGAASAPVVVEGWSDFE
jgi:hypothetical protein